MNAESTVARIRGELGELRLFHMDQRPVIPAFQVDLWQMVDAFIDDNVKAVAFTDWRHGAVCAIPEQLVDLTLPGEIDDVTKLPPQFRQADTVRCWKDGEQIAAIAAQYHAFG
jgi:hypothetical protein